MLYLWDLPAAQLIYKAEGISAQTPPILSAHGLYMAVPEGEKVTIIETATGKVRRRIPTGTTLAPGVAFHPSGRALVICFSNQFMVWDCVADRLITQATTTDHLGAHPVNFIGPKMFLSALGSVVDVELAMPVWKYSTSGATEPTVMDGHLVVATTSGHCQLISVEVPHAPAVKAARTLARAGDAAMLVRPGTKVSIAVEALPEVDREEIQRSLAAAAEKAGWKVSDDAPITLVAKIGRGKSQQLHYRSLGGNAPTESTATLTPFTAELEIRRGADVLWTRSTTNHVPGLLHLEPGETVQDAVKRFEKPNATFFAMINLPPRIPKPDVATSIGLSTLKDGQWHEMDLRAIQSGPRSRARGR